MSCKILMTVPVLCVGLAGCTLPDPNRRIGQEDPFFGESVRYNAAVQTINPDPVYAEGGAQPGDNGDRGAQAVKRYRTDQVRTRHRSEASSASQGLSTTQSGSGGGSGPR